MHTTTKSTANAADSIPPKLRELATLIAAQRPSPEQIETLISDVVKATGFPRRSVRFVLDLAIREGRS